VTRGFRRSSHAAKTASLDGDDLSIERITPVTFDDVDDAVFALMEAVKKAAAAPKRGV
jgi:hypothetical protein